MAKAVILDVLENTIGKYVLNLDASALNVAVWKGNIELHSLQLDVNAVNADLAKQAMDAPNLALPFRVESGSFQSLSVEVPWAKLSSHAVVFRASGLHIKLELHNFLNDTLKDGKHPVAEGDTNNNSRLTEREQDIISAEKIRERSNALRNLANSNEVDEGELSNDVKGDSFGARLVRRILENLQVEISDIKIELHGSGCRIGAILETLKLTTTDKTGVPTFVDRRKDDHFLYKALTIDGLGMYCDDDLSVYSLERMISLHDFILSPLSFSASLRQSDLERCVTSPKYLFSSHLSDIAVAISRSQAEHLKKMADDIQRMKPQLHILFPEYRPLKPISKKTAKDWWKYALRCVGRLNRKRSWVEFFLAFQKRQRYVQLFKRHSYHTECPWMTELSVEELIELKHIENDRSIAINGVMSWRNLAESQMKLERLKHDATQLERKKQKRSFLSIFGNKPSDSLTSVEYIVEPPIVLSIDEMRDLETLALEHATETLTEDSRLAEVNFILSSLSIDFVGSKKNQLANFGLGRVGIDFATNVDGSLSFGLSLQNVNLSDFITKGTKFPSIVRSLKVSKNALEFKMEKTKTGDQILFLNLATFELVASPVFIREMINFVIIQSEGHVEDIQRDELKRLFSARDEQSKDTLADAIADAWSYKNKNQQTWKVDCIIHAPILVIPEDCVDLDANVLVLDMGEFHFKYGCEPSIEIVDWFQSKNSTSPIDHLKLGMTKLALYSGSVSDKISSDILPGLLVETMLKPLSFHVDIGLENVSDNSLSRICLQSIIPFFNITLSLERLQLLASVILKWKTFFEDFDSWINATDMAGNESVDNNQSPPMLKNHKPIRGGDSTSEITALEKVFGFVKLNRFSIDIVDGNDKVEAHLVSVAGSMILYDNDSSKYQMRLGWFGVRDLLERGYPRKQRLIMHSDLPESFGSLSTNDSLLDDIGAMASLPDDDFPDLAKISFLKNQLGFHNGNNACSGIDVLHTNMSSLFFNWNPRVISDLLTFFAGFMDEAKKLVTNESQPCDKKSSLEVFNQGNISDSFSSQRINNSERMERKLMINLSMKSLTLTLNSAQDDLPIYLLTMANTLIDLETFYEDMSIIMKLGDLRIETQPMDMVCSSYRTILGLAENQTASLLIVKYFKGCFIKKSDFHHEQLENCDAVASIELSPMHIIYIQAQIMTLVDYMTTGILGTLTRQVASSAAAAAIEVTKAVDGEQLFLINASSLDVVLPQAASKPKFLTLGIDLVNIQYRMLGADAGGICDLLLRNLSLSCSEGFDIIDDPICASVKVILPGQNAVSEHDKAKHVSVHIPTISLRLLKDNFLQLMNTLDENISEKDTFFRDKALHKLYSESFLSNEVIPEISHAGGEIFEDSNRLYFCADIDVLSVNLFAESDDAPLLEVRTEETGISMQLLPDQNKTSIDLKLLNVEADDKRVECATQPLRRLIGKRSDATVSTNAAIVFSLENFENGSRSANVEIGETQFVFLPDLVEEVIDFFQRPKSDEAMFASQNTSSNSVIDESNFRKHEILSGVQDSKPIITRSIRELPSFLDDSEVSEKHSKDVLTEDTDVKTFKICVTSTECQFLLIDMGINVNSIEPRRSQKVKTSTLISEVVALQGKVRAELCSTFINNGDDILSSSSELHCDQIQIFKAQGEGLSEPVQILEPVDFSIILQNMNSGLKSTIKFVTLTEVMLTCSIQDLALFRAIMSSITSSKKVSTHDRKVEELTKQEEDRIETLVKLLKDDKTSSFTESSSIRSSSKGSIFVDGEEKTFDNDIERKYREFQGYLTLSGVTFLIVNDLEGLDSALFKVGVENFLGSASIATPLNLDGSCDMVKATGEAQLHTSFKANYFDSVSNKWEPLLLNEWEWTINCMRKAGKLIGKKQFLQTSVDIEARSCALKFSEQFLVSLGGANKMWTLYSAKSETEKRSLVTSTPYGIENKCGVPLFYKPQGKGVKRICLEDSIDYFRFQYSVGKGFGGIRLYGQDIIETKSILISIGNNDFEASNSVITIQDIDKELNKLRSYCLKDGRVVFVEVVRTGRTMVVRLRSRIQIRNCTHIPVAVVTQTARGLENAGICGRDTIKPRKLTLASVRYSQPDFASSPSWSSLGIPLNVLQQYDSLGSKTAGITLLINPIINEGEKSSANLTTSNQNVIGLWGVVALPPPYALKQLALGDESITSYDMTCSLVGCDNLKNPIPFVMQVFVEVKEVDDQPYVDIFLHPRLILKNLLPIGTFIRTPMPYTFDQFRSRDESSDTTETIHYLIPQQSVYIFTPGPSIAISFKLADAPIRGGLTGWLEGEWLNIPLSKADSRTSKIVVQCLLPFIDSPGGHAILLSEDENLSHLRSLQTYQLTFKPQNIAIDHTGDFVFVGTRVERRPGEKQQRKLLPHAWSAFSKPNERKCITLLPGSSEDIYLVKANDSKLRSQVLRVEEIAVGNGGLESSAIFWKNKEPSGYFAYRILEKNEIHIIPEYIIFNGCDFKILIKHSGHNFILEPGKMAPIKNLGETEKMSIVLMIEILDLDAITVPVLIESLGLKLCGLQSTLRKHDNSHLIGSIAIQTVIGASDSRWVIKVGDLKMTGDIITSNRKNDLLVNDFLRYRLRLDDFQITLCDTVGNNSHGEFTDVIHIVLSGNLFDYQRIFKEEESSSDIIERSQVALIIDSIKAVDCYEGSLFPVVVDSPFSKSFLNILIRFRNDHRSDILKVDLIDFNIGFKSGTKYKIILGTSEEFVWKLLDVMNRISHAVAKMTEDLVADNNVDYKYINDLGVESDDDEDLNDDALEVDHIISEEGCYSPPQSDLLFDIKIARVSPVSLIVSFKRTPVASRYKKVMNTRGAKLMNYFTQSLKFTVDKAEINFCGYIEKHIRGPPDRIKELVIAEYTNRLKFQALALMKATSIQDWKNLTGRNEGNDEYTEGDIIRSAGHLTGKSASFVLKTATSGISDGINTVTGAIGSGVISATTALGVGDVGHGVNSVVTGFGGGIGSTVIGVGTGAGKVFKGTGTGIGQVFGGLGGGVIKAAKGIQKGVTEGDGGAVIDGFGEGASTVGKGLKNGVVSVATGVGDGLTAGGKGIIKGVKMFGKGIRQASFRSNSSNKLDDSDED